jgi:hypothetical protein
MRKIVWPVVILVLSIAAWLSVIKASPLIAYQILKASNECPSGSITLCKDTLSALGASGDVFGAITSLFSGLALFAVSYTLWSDANARRESRKPLVTNYLNDNSIIIRYPKLSPEPEFELYITSKVSNKNGEAALNVAIRCQIKSEDRLLADFQSHLSQPLVSEGTEDFEKTVPIKGKALTELLGRLTEDEKPITFIFRIGYNSLENVNWETNVIYDVTCKAGDRRKRLNSLRSSTDDFSSLWDNGAQVSLEAQVRVGSWLHHRK